MSSSNNQVGWKEAGALTTAGFGPIVTGVTIGACAGPFGMAVGAVVGTFTSLVALPLTYNELTNKKSS
jgi:hypothetical protein